MPEQGPKKELSMQLRLLLSFLLMDAVMLVFQLWLKPPVEEQKKIDTTASAPPKPGEPTAPAVSPPVATTAELVPPSPNQPVTPAIPQPNYVIENQYFRVALSNQGGTVRSWQLKEFKGNDNKLLNMVNPGAGMQFPFSLYFPGQKPATDVNWAWYKQTGDPDGMGVTYEYSDGHTTIVKSFKFEKDSYISRVTTSVMTDGKPIPHMIEWRGGFGDHTVTNAASTQRTLYFDVAQNKLVEHNIGSTKSGPVTNSGAFTFAGVSDQYFAAVFLPQDGDSMQLVTFPDWLKTPTIEKP